MSTASQVLNVQYAALPWRRQNGVLQVLLITTRGTRRWIIPKGWPATDLPPSQAAAREALEEAGVVGEVASRKLGAFDCHKRLKNGAVLPLRVEVFALEVAQQRRNWPEKGLRDIAWCTLDEALARVSEPGLRKLITKFARTTPANRVVDYGSTRASA